MNFDMAESERDCKIAVAAFVVKEVISNDIPLVTQTNHEFRETVMGINFHDVPQDRHITNSDHRFRSKLRFLPQPGTQTARQNYNFHRTPSVIYSVRPPKQNNSQRDSTDLLRKLSRATASRDSARSPPKQNYLCRLQQYLQVQNQRPILDVVQVVSQLLASVAHAGAVLETHLCPAGQARRHKVAVTIQRNQPIKFGRQCRLFRTGTDKTHVASKHVPKLRQFVQPQTTNHPSRPGNTWIVFLGPIGTTVCWSAAH